MNDLIFTMFVLATMVTVVIIALSVEAGKITEHLGKIAESLGKIAESLEKNSAVKKEETHAE